MDGYAKTCEECRSSLEHTTIFMFQDAFYCGQCCPWRRQRSSFVAPAPEPAFLPHDAYAAPASPQSSVASAEPRRPRSDSDDSLTSSMDSCQISPTHDLVPFAPEPWQQHPPARQHAPATFACCVGR